MAEVFQEFDEGVHVLSRGEADVLAERRRQHHEEGFDAGHDDKHVKGELIKAAICYAWAAFLRTAFPLEKEVVGAISEPDGWFRLDFLTWWWPWDRSWWKSAGIRRMLVKAAALLIAEIERIDRAADKSREGER